MPSKKFIPKSTTMPRHNIQTEVHKILVRSGAIHSDFCVPEYDPETGIEGTLDLIVAGMQHGCLVVARKVDDKVAFTFRNDINLAKL